MALRSVPDTSTTPTPSTPTLQGYVRDRLMTGEVVALDEIAATMEVTRDQARHAVGNLRHAGLAIDRVGKMGEGRYRLGKASRIGTARVGGGKTATATATGTRAKKAKKVTVTAATPLPPSDVNEAADEAIDRWTNEAGAMEEAGISAKGRRKVKVTEAPMLGSRLRVVALALERGDVVAKLEGDGDMWTAVLRK